MADEPGGIGAGVLIRGLLAGDRRALARAISLVESGDLAARRLAAGLGWPPGSRVIALTGPPGVGKSTLANRLAAAFADAGESVGVVAVDPTSPKSGGALLGDRVRMSGDRAEVFFRSMAARSASGGLAPEISAVLRLMAASGATRILLETAGAGQGDHAATKIADLSVAVAAPGFGDRVQAAKAGLFEVADLVVVNQADRPGAEAMATDFGAFREGPVALTSAREGTGVEELCAALEQMLAERRAPDRSPLSALGRALGATRLHHVGVAVRDGDRAADLWRSLLGLREEARYEVDEFGVLALFLAPEAGEESDPGCLVELVEPTAADNPVARFLSRRGEGLHHICFEVEDLRATLAALEAQGVRLLDREPRLGAGGHQVAFVHPSSAGGVLLELKQA